MSDMKSIRFPAPVADAMVRVILEGRKTVTRRVVKPPALDKMIVDDNGECIGSLNCQPGWEVDIYPTIDDSPYQPGDILYVKERVAYLFGRYGYRADYDEVTEKSKPFWKPSVRMPKEAARLFLRVTDVRVELLRDITGRDALAEGVDNGRSNPTMGQRWENMQRMAFSDLWNSTIKKADLPGCGWEANPWVWVIEFERISREEAQKYEE